MYLTVNWNGLKMAIIRILAKGPIFAFSVRQSKMDFERAAMKADDLGVKFDEEFVSGGFVAKK